MKLDNLTEGNILKYLVLFFIGLAVVTTLVVLAINDNIYVFDVGPRSNANLVNI